VTVVAPFALSYTNRVPYISVAEFMAAPTGLDLSNLVQGRDGVSQNTALQELIARASARADNYCFGAYGTLCATVNTEPGQIRADRQGFYRVNPRYWPILAINSFSVGTSPGNLQPVPLSSATCWIEESGFVITQGAINSVTVIGPIQFGAGGTPGSRVFAEWTYVNGWPNLFLAADAAQGASSIVSSVVPEGVFPGTVLNIWDPPNDEPITVGAGYTVGSTTIPLVNPLVSAHSAGVNVSALPQTVKQAVIYLVTSSIRERGEVGFTLGPEGAPQEVQRGSSAQSEDEALAYDLLDPFRAVVR